MQVKCYWNSHDQCYSIQHKGKVIGYSRNLILKDCGSHINEGGRQRVLREKKKDVHAYLTGYLNVKDHLIIADKPWIAASLRAEELKAISPLQIRYNPYKHSNFRVCFENIGIDLQAYLTECSNADLSPVACLSTRKIEIEPFYGMRQFKHEPIVTITADPDIFIDVFQEVHKISKESFLTLFYYQSFQQSKVNFSCR